MRLARRPLAILALVGLAFAVGLLAADHGAAGAADRALAAPSLSEMGMGPGAIPGVVYPPPRQDASMAYDAATHTIVLFGGNSCNFGCTTYGDTWLWDGRAWHQAFPATSPPPRFGATMAYDPDTRTVILFGGQICVGNFCYWASDTWAWNGTNWVAPIVEPTPPGTPTPFIPTPTPTPASMTATPSGPSPTPPTSPTPFGTSTITPTLTPFATVSRTPTRTRPTATPTRGALLAPGGEG